MSLIVGKNLSLVYPGAALASLKNVNFTIESGRSNLFLGRSGSGKTSLLKCVAQLNTAYSGSIKFDGVDVCNLPPANKAKSIGYVAQQFNLFSHFTVLENCVHPQTHVLGISKEEAILNSELLLTQLEVANLKDRKPKELSGGQAQRVAIARALAMNPRLLLLDEPTSALDPESTNHLALVLNKLIEQGITITISTHDMAFAKKILDRVYFMDFGEIIESYDAANSRDLSSKKIASFLN